MKITVCEIMSSATETVEEQQKLQIYPTSKAGVSPFWRGFSKLNSLADFANYN